MNGTRDSAAFRREGLRIGGETVHTGRTFDVRNPYSGERVGTVAMAGDTRRSTNSPSVCVPGMGVSRSCSMRC